MRATGRTGMPTAPESVSRRSAQLQGSAVDLALGPRLVQGPLAFWMQTTGATLLAVEPRSLAHAPTTAQDGRSACGLLYLAAVQCSFHAGHNHLIRRDLPPHPLPAHPALICRNTAHQRAVSDGIERPRAAKKRPGQLEEDARLSFGRQSRRC